MSKLIAIDIGHGSDTYKRTDGKGVKKDGRVYQEHDFNSKVAIELDKLLRHNGFKTLLYQKPFSPEIGLKRRSDYYNARRVDLVWSIHANANSNKEVDGRCAFYWHSASGAKKLAELFVDEIEKAGYDTHGHGTHASKTGSWTNFHIVRETNMTAVLTENGFMSNDTPGINDDFELLFGSKQAQYVKEIARVHAKAICRYYGVGFSDPHVYKTAGFKDVDIDAYYAKAVHWLQDNKIMEGYPDGSFKPDKEITRGEFAYALYRALNK